MLPPTEGRADSRMARPPRSEPLSTDALSDPVSLEGVHVFDESETDIQWALGGQSPRLQNPMGKKPQEKLLDRTRRPGAGRQADRRLPARTQVRRSSPTLGTPPYLRCVPLIGNRSGTGGAACRARNPPGMATGAAPLRACPAANAQIIANITADCDLIISHLPSVSKPDPLYQR